MNYIKNLILFILGASAISLIGHLAWDWEFVWYRVLIQHFFTGLLFSWLLTESKKVVKRSKKNKS